MSRIYVKPKPGLSIPSPDHGGANLPTDGDWVTRSTYWDRRIANQEVDHDKDKIEPVDKPAKPAKPEDK